MISERGNGEIHVIMRRLWAIKICTREMQPKVRVRIMSIMKMAFVE